MMKRQFPRERDRVGKVFFICFFWADSALDGEARGAPMAEVGGDDGELGEG